MQNYFKSNNIPYLMFNALWNGFDIPLTKECGKLLGQVDEKCFYKLRGTSQETQHGWCVERKLNVSDLDDHPNLQGQEAWAEELLPQVKAVFDAN